MLYGLVHAGGVLQDATVANMSLSKCRAVFAPKVSGLDSMETSLQLAPMGAVVMFSSISSLLGGVGQANYSAANAALDASATVRQGQGQVGGSVQWGTWAGGGMALRDPSTMRRAEQTGLGVVQPDVGLEVLGLFMQSSATAGAGVQPLEVGVVSPFVWATFLAMFPRLGVFTEFEAAELVQLANVPQSSVRKKQKTIRKKQKTPQSQQEVSREEKEMLYQQVTSAVAAVLGGSVEADEPLMDAGLDSLGAVELRNALAKVVGMELPGTLVFDYPSSQALIGYFQLLMLTTHDEPDTVEHRVSKPCRRKCATCSKRGLPAQLSRERSAAMQAQVLEVVLSVLGKPVGVDEPLMDAGLDSLGAV